jgi:WD40 repeat protein
LRLKQTLNRGDRTNRSIRVVKYRPINNDQAVVGFENGQIELWNLSMKQPQPFSTISQDDRIFDLALPEDARSVYADADAVFSGHGSGMVVQRSFSNPEGNPKLLFDKERSYAVQALSLVGMAQQYLAVAGRSNKLDVMDLSQPRNSEPLAKVPYREGGTNDYIVSLDSPLNRPNMLGASDTQGFVSVWTIEACVAAPDAYGNRGDCKLLDEWSGVSDAIIRAIAFTPDGCFLATGGDEGIIKVWPLTPAGVRDPDFPNGKIIDVLKTSVNAVDILRTGEQLTVISGADDGHIRLKSVHLSDFPHEGHACPQL